MIFDGHSDIFTDVTVRRLKGETQVLKNHHLPRLRKGNLMKVYVAIHFYIF